MRIGGVKKMASAETGDDNRHWSISQLLTHIGLVQYAEAFEDNMNRLHSYTFGVDSVAGAGIDVPCFPTSKAKVVEPEETVQHKNVHRYGETNIKYVPHRLTREQWQRRHNMPNRPLPAVPYREPEPAQTHTRSTRTDYSAEPRPVHMYPRSPQSTVEYLDTTSTEPHTLPRHPRSARSLRSTRSDYTVSSAKRPPRYPRQKQAATNDFFVSVPIFNETMDHSYRKKYEYIYEDRDGMETSSLNNSGSIYNSGALHPPGTPHYSSLRDVRHDSGYRHHGRSPSHQQSRGRADSEPSYDSQSESSRVTGGGYLSETFEQQAHMRQVSTRGWTNIDSDDDDYR